MPRKFADICSLSIDLEEECFVGKDDRPFVNVDICDETYSGLLDSGAVSSVMNKSVCNYLLSREYKLYSCNVAITTVDGTMHMAEGYMKVDYELRGIRRKVPTLVVNNLKTALVLGWDFWDAFGIKPCFVSKGQMIVSETCGIQIVNQKEEISHETIFMSEQIDEASDITPPKCINVEQPHELSSRDQQLLDEVVSKLPFCKPEGELNKTWMREATIDTGNASPVRCKLRIIPPAKLARVIEEIDRLERRGIIRKVESSEWLHPMLAVPKSNGNLRICMDARCLNKVTKKNAYPQQNANRILSMIGKAEYISTIDLTDAYFQIPLDKDSQEKTAFAVPTRGTYVYCRMPMGLTNSGAVLCSLIDSLFGAEFEPNGFPYLDDIVVVTETFDAHIDILGRVGEKLTYAGLTISPSKSKFAYKRLKYLGHILDVQGIAMDKSRIEAIENFPRPRCVKDIQRLMGLAGWYRRFIRNFSEITAPISELEKKSVTFEWNEDRERAFQKLIRALTSAPILANPRYDLPFEIQADASRVACGAVLVQHHEGEERVIAYMSQKFSATQQKYHVTELECLAVILSIEKFRPYVEGTHFKVITDHHALIWLKNLKDPTGRLARWSLRLQAYDFTLVHRKGKFHVVPDALSRAVSAINASRNFDTTDKWYLKHKALALEKPQEYDKFKVHNELLYFNPSPNDEECDQPNCLWRLCIPKECRESIIRENHDNGSACHGGRYKTIAKVRTAYYWPGMNEDVAKYVRECEVCKLIKPHNKITTPPAGEFVEANRPFRVIASDIVGPLPLSKNQNRFLVVAIDLFSKFTIMRALKTATAKNVTEFIQNEVILKFSCPEILVCDNGVQYKSELFKNLMASRGIRVWYTANYFAQGNPTECVNKTIGTALRAFIMQDSDQREWDRHIHEIENAINSSHHTSTKETPYFVAFGQRMPQHAREYAEVIDANVEMPRSEANFREMREKVQQRLNEAREKATKYYNLRTRPVDYKIGDTVYRENTQLSEGAAYFSKKLSPRFVKSVIVEKTGTNTYKLKEMESGKENIYHAQKFHK